MAKFAYFQHPERPGSIIRTENPEYWGKSDGYERLPAKEGAELYRENIRAAMLEDLKPGDRVYCVLRDVARSGMSRTLDLFIVKEGRLARITHSAAVLTGTPQRDGGPLKVAGCGFDAGHHVVYALGCALWPDGTPEPHGTRNGEPDRAGGYALKHDWL